MTKMFFEMPELLNLDGSIFSGLYSEDDVPPGGCGSGCRDGCASGCGLGHGAGFNVGPEPTG